jgi:1-acyl-sn-glycerol-3-phosphate acyltransferase
MRWSSLVFWGGWVLSRLVGIVFFRMKAEGREHLPKEGAFILAPNHRSYFDPPLIGSCVNRELFFFAKAELFRNRVFGALISLTNAFPVRRGRVDSEALRRAGEVLAAGHGLVMFPEGTRSRTGEFLPAKPGIGMIAIKAGCPIVPVYAHGNADLKSCFWFRRRLRVVFGEPFSAEWVRQFPAEPDGYRRLAEAVLERIKAIQAERFGSSAEVGDGAEGGKSA